MSSCYPYLKNGKNNYRCHPRNCIPGNCGTHPKLKHVYFFGLSYILKGMCIWQKNKDFPLFQGKSPKNIIEDTNFQVYFVQKNKFRVNIKNFCSCRSYLNAQPIIWDCEHTLCCCYNCTHQTEFCRFLRKHKGNVVHSLGTCGCELHTWFQC